MAQIRCTAASSSIVPSKSVPDRELALRTVPASRPLVDFTTLITISTPLIVDVCRRDVPRDAPSGLGVFPRVRGARRRQGDDHEHQSETH